MTKITHFTKRPHLESIINDGVIYKEGHNYVTSDARGEMRGTDALSTAKRRTWKMLKQQYKLTGRYVWFTEEDSVNCIDAEIACEKVGISFNAEEIGAKRWSEVRKAKMRSKKAKMLIEALEMAALMVGDEPTKWWVTTNDVALSDAAEVGNWKLKQRKVVEGAIYEEEAA